MKSVTTDQKKVLAKNSKEFVRMIVEKRPVYTTADPKR